ncbi:MAG: hypothetical protein HZA51_11525 [Planctomycetes bacterium]|nr:hypothetical protein [Planctomycetota bacterium]
MFTRTKGLGKITVATCLLTVLKTGSVFATPIFVDARATTGGNNGSDWDNAYLDLQDAITLAYSAPATYPEIRVAQGRYTPDSGTLDASMFFRLMKNVHIKGGYAGVGESNPNDRNSIRYITILTGDLNNDDIVCDVESNRSDNSSYIISGVEPDQETPVDLTAVLDGFTITGATASAIYLENTSRPTIINCNISFNKSVGGDGAALYCSFNCFPDILECTFEGNGAKYAGAIYLSGLANARIIDCKFVRNATIHNGGAIYLEAKARPTIQGCIFEANNAASGGAIAIANSLFDDIRPRIEDCKFINNYAATNGGAITNANKWPFDILSCLFAGNHTTSSLFGGGNGGAVFNDTGTTNQFVNCAFSRNSSVRMGGAIFNGSTSTASTLALINCSFSNNTATNNGGGVRAESQVSLTIHNSLFLGNTSSDSGALNKQISTNGGATTVTYSSIEGCSGGCFSGTANNDTDPTFVNAAADNLRLQSSSQVIDSANNCQISGSITTDLDGATRRINDSTTNTGVDCTSPAPPTPVQYLDRGAYEFNRSLDCNNNTVNDNADIASGTSYDCNRDGIPDECLAPCLKGDVNHDTVVNGLDIRALVNRLLGASTCAYGDCETDVNGDNAVNVGDIPCFVDVLMGSPGCAYSCSPTLEALYSPDCNANEVNDANDIADGTSQDCNNNFIPDECDIDTSDPDGNESVSPDVNSNGVPDECEPDCNNNSIPDAWDISESTSTDANSNDIPDECEKDCNENGRPDDLDIACGGGNTCNSLAGSYDCNANGTPDECEVDCNENGVPDDCDIDPLDPDGNEEVSDDCNEDGMPDECNLALPAPYGSFDCNENGVLDECDIASEYSDDANENGVPDECEEEELHTAPNGGTRMGGADSKGLTDGDDATSGASMMIQAPSEEVWEAFFEWSFSQCWGLDCETTTGEQFDAYVNKLMELGLTMP